MEDDAVNVDDAAASLFSSLDVSAKNDIETMKIPDEKDMEREAFLQVVKEYGPKHDYPYPNYIRMDHATGLLYADPDKELVRLDHCTFVPLRYHAISNELRKEHHDMAMEEFEKLSQNPLFSSFLIPTPALLIRLSSRPGKRVLESIEEAKMAVIQKYKEWVEDTDRSEMSEEEFEKERKHILQNYIHLEFQATDAPLDREQYEDKGWNRYITTGEAIVQYMRAKKLIEMTSGFSRYDMELKRVMGVYIHKANGQFTDGIIELGRTINHYITDDIDGLVSQILTHGEIHDLSCVDPIIIEAACIMYTIGMVRLLERWLLSVIGVMGNEFMDYHCIGTYIETQFIQDYSLIERCARENADVFSIRRLEENERWRTLPMNKSNILNTFTQWPVHPSSENIQFPPRMFTKEMCAVTACYVAYARAEDRHSFNMAMRLTERSYLLLGTKAYLGFSDYMYLQTFWISGEEDPIPLWKPTLRADSATDEEETEDYE